MVTVVRKSVLPTPAEVPERLREAAQAAAAISLREPRLAGFPLFFTDSMDIIEPVVAFLHEHAIQRAHTADTLRTYAEILFDWFDTLEQSSIAWDQVDGADLVVYRNRMLKQPSPLTGRAYSIRTINHRVRGVLRFYGWAPVSGVMWDPTPFTASRRPADDAATLSSATSIDRTGRGRLNAIRLCLMSRSSRGRHSRLLGSA
jgi:hypothetical protein